VSEIFLEKSNSVSRPLNLLYLYRIYVLKTKHIVYF